MSSLSHDCEPLKCTEPMHMSLRCFRREKMQVNNNSTDINDLILELNSVI